MVPTSGRARLFGARVDPEEWMADLARFPAPVLRESARDLSVGSLRLRPRHGETAEEAPSSPSRRERAHDLDVPTQSADGFRARIHPVAPPRRGRSSPYPRDGPRDRERARVEPRRSPPGG